MSARDSKPGFTLPFLRRRAEEEAASLPGLIAAAQHAANTVTGGDHARRKAGSGEKFWQFRDYHPGDRPQDIDWRQSAKGDRVFIRQKEWQTAQTALLWAAAGKAMDYSSDSSHSSKREAALICALATGTLMIRAGEKVGLLDGSILPGRGEAALERIAQNLLNNKSGALPAATAIPRHANIVLAGDFLQPIGEIEAAFDAIAARATSGLVIQILDPAELALPFSGRVIFEDMAGDEHHNIAHVASVREQYRQRIEDHLIAVENLCHRLQWQWILHTTDTPVRDTLSDAWRMLMPHNGSHAA